MKRLPFLFLLLFSFNLLAQDIILTNVRIVDVERGKALPPQSVFISNGRIAAIGNKIKTTASAQVVNASGKYVIPGLWDMHVHTTGANAPQVDWPLLLAYGVTGVRDMGGHGLAQLNLSKQAWRKGAPGPRIYGAGKILDGKPEIHTDQGVNISNTQEAETWVNRVADEGADFVKVYELLRPEQLVAISGAAKKRGLKVVGHVPMSTTVAQAAAHMHTMEHLRGFDYACTPLEDSLVAQTSKSLDTTSATGRAFRAKVIRGRLAAMLAAFDSVRTRALLRLLKRTDVFQCPTLIVGNTLLVTRFDTTAGFRQALQHMPDSTIKKWERQFATAPKPTENKELFQLIKDEWAFKNKLVNMMNEQGVPLLAGTDINLPFLIPGYSLHQELGLLVGAGLTPAQALQSATVNAARCLGLEKEVGTIAKGKWADLVLLDANPLTDITNAKKIAAVVANGKLYDRKALDALLKSVRNGVNASKN